MNKMDKVMNYLGDLPCRRTGWFGRWLAAILPGLLGLLWACAASAVTIWPASVVPAVVDTGADSAVELGVKFRSDVPGNVTGIRFYKASQNTGSHVANLWSSSGSRLATATFASESASGWQQVLFASPVAITANTVYTASYHCTIGHYSFNSNYFASAGVDAAPLHALVNGESGGNGTYAYGTASAFPDNSYQSGNYWVDVVFEATNQTDTTAPTVSSVGPSAGATGVSSTSSVVILFSEAMNASTVNSGTILLRDGAGALVSASVAYDSSANTATLTPVSGLAPSTTYSATVKGSPGGVTDLAGNQLSTDYNWSFTTASSGVGGGATTGTILVITSTTNPFADYYAEILLAEGLNEFVRADLSTVTSTTLAGFDVVILGQIALTNQQATLLSDWVNAGGKLIAMRPDKKLAGLLGLSDAGTTLSQGYLLVNTSSGPGVGIVGQTIQFHGTADRYTLAGATSLAALYSGAQTATTNPAVTLRTVGSNGGQAAAFTYDLARSVIYTRQGNPAWVGQDRDGLSPSRSTDLFFGNASFDPQPDWIDLTKVAIPQADEQQRLLANLIISMASAQKLLPRFWYFPFGYQAAIVMTGDDHGNNGTAGRFDYYKSVSTPGASVADWKTIRSTSYLYPNSTLTDKQALDYNNAGFELALHINTGCSDYTASSLRAIIDDQRNQFMAHFPSLPAMVTTRIHCIAWSGYTIAPEVEREFGIRMDTSYYYYPPDWIQNRPGMFTGSGMPMRFANSAGTTLDIYQAVTQMTDESGQTYPFTVDSLLDRALGSEGYYGAFVANMHTDTVASDGSDAIVSSALARGVPIISARQLLTWTDARNASVLKSVGWANSTMTFTVAADANARGLQGMAPIPKGASITSLKFNGTSISYSVKPIKGIAYAIFDALSGDYQVSYAQDTTAPTVSSIEPPSGQTGVSVGTKVSVTFSEAMAASTINQSTLSLKDSTSTVVPSTVTYNSSSFVGSLTPTTLLKAGSTYTATVQGGAGGVTDAAGNLMASSVVSTFTTGVSQLYTIWPNTTTPAVLASSDTRGVEVGLKFRSSVSGSITKVRFYKGVGNTGTHVGSIWNTGGTRLGSVVFANETASGWQAQTFASPIPVAANTTYIVSYYAPNGRYAVTSGYFAGGGFNSAPLRALADGEDGGNGVFRYGSGSSLPNRSSNSSNYWVDLEFASGQ